MFMLMILFRRIIFLTIESDCTGSAAICEFVHVGLGLSSILFFTLGVSHNIATENMLNI